MKTCGPHTSPLSLASPPKQAEPREEREATPAHSTKQMKGGEGGVWSGGRYVITKKERDNHVFCCFFDGRGYKSDFRRGLLFLERVVLDLILLGVIYEKLKISRCIYWVHVVYIFR